MSLKDIFKQQQSGMEALATTGVIGMHLVSGPLVGFALGYGLDYWLDTGPWGKLLLLLLGIAAGFLNVYRDTQRLLRKLAAEDARRKGFVPDSAPDAASGSAKVSTGTSPGQKTPTPASPGETNGRASAENHDAQP